MRIYDGYLTMIPSVVALLPGIPISIWILRRDADRRWKLMALLAVMHLSLLVALAIFPIPIAGQDYYRRTRGFSEDNVIPFATISFQVQHLGLSTVRQLFGNAVALAPAGIYGPGLWPRLRNWRLFAVIAIAFGCGIELTQLAGSLIEGFTYRVTDIDDAIMNASGAVAAFFVWREMERRGLVDRWFGRWLDPNRSTGAPVATPPPARFPG